MFFNIDSDDGRVIRGWLAPDNPSAVPKILVRRPGEEDAEILATIERPDVRDLGVHVTGLVGFMIDDTIVKGLPDLEDIELLEADTGILIYRRFKEGKHIERKFFLFDSSIRPIEKLSGRSRNLFTLSYPSTERYAFETMLVLINNNFNKSIFMSGRSSFPRYSHFLSNAQFTTAALLSDPFEELAQRLVILSLIQKSDSNRMLPLLFTGLTALTNFVRGLPFEDSKGMLAKFRNLTDEEREALVSPMTRMFGCIPGETPERRHVTTALENLASMDLVGVRSRFRDFSAMLAGILGHDLAGDYEPVAHPSISALADRLSRISLVADLLEDDLALYSFAEESIVSALSDDANVIARDTQTI
ncbi:MAG: hypothetical protein FJX16_02655 [Alphaproteobacteria bacterium]|nr:hypothetical protein [Alphaproteobacteria bacterium]MBM3624220.1 hypothetical protein [Alphaproteobacteria bacterium]